MCNRIVLLILALALYCPTSWATSLITASNGGFENATSTFPANGWTVVNGTQTNKWFVGATGVPSAGTKCAYISDNGAGSTYNFNIITTSVVHFYRDIIIPAGEPELSLTFKWK